MMVGMAVAVAVSLPLLDLNNCQLCIRNGWKGAEAPGHTAHPAEFLDEREVASDVQDIIYTCNFKINSLPLTASPALIESRAQTSKQKAV